MKGYRLHTFMILQILNRNINVFLSKQIWILISVFSVFSFRYLLDAKVKNLTLWDFMTNVITDQYYILYFLMIFYIFSVFKIIKDTNSLILIRTKKYIQYLFTQVISLFSISSILILIHILILGIMGSILNKNSIFSPEACNANEVIATFYTYFKTPILAISLHIIYMILGLTFVGILMLAISGFLKKKSTVAVIIALYILTLLGFNTDINKAIPFIFLDEYVILHHALDAFNSKFYIMILSEFIFASLILYVIGKFGKIND